MCPARTGHYHREHLLTRADRRADARLLPHAGAAARRRFQRDQTRVSRVGAAVSVEPGQPWWTRPPGLAPSCLRDACATLTTAAAPSTWPPRDAPRLEQGLQGVAGTLRRPFRIWAGVERLGAARRSWLSARTQTSGARMSPAVSKCVIQHFRARVSTTDKGQNPLPLVQLLVLHPVKPVRPTQMNMYDICRSPFCVWPHKS